jgi:adenylate cyclase
MARYILLWTQTHTETEQLRSALNEAGVEDVEPVVITAAEEAEAHLFERQVVALVVDWSISGVPEFVHMLKADQMFAVVPVLAVLHSTDDESVRSVLETGVDTYVSAERMERLWVEHVVNLVRNRIVNVQMEDKISDLQDRAIHDYLLLELVRKYIPGTIWNVAQEYAHEQKISIPEQQTELTIVFADIAQFTPLAQYAEPEQVVRDLNTVFEIATRHVYDSGGDVDKFIGDAFFAVFEDAETAVRSMVAIQDEMVELNKDRTQNGLRSVKLRIGVHSGAVIRGNVGGNERYDNTLIGDPVNMASRLQTVAPPGGIVISEETRAKAGFEIPDSHKRNLKLRGRDQEETVYSVYAILSDKARVAKEAG